MTAWDNIAYPVKRSGKSKEEVARRVEELINLFEIKFNLNLYPYELSGGQQQTVSIMRALAMKPEILFLDEPFSALDFEMTLFIRTKLQEANLSTGVTMMIVSHDLEDAVFLADKILLLTRRPTRIAEFMDFTMSKPRAPESVSEPEFIKNKSHALEIFQREMRA
jgi:NitT/TauT family transport system ATP-binding protein